MENGRLNGKLITNYMKATGTEYGAIAAEIGVSTSIVRQMEQGYIPRRNREQILTVLAQYLGHSVGALVIPSGAKKAS